MTAPRTRAELLDAGLTEADLRSAERRGEIRRVLTGVYVDPSVPDSVELRVRATARVVAPGHIVCDRSAAWLHGVDVFAERERELLACVETCVLRGRQPSERGGVAGHSRDLARYDIVTLDGLRVTTPQRTALDLGAGLKRATALAALDGLMAAHGFGPADLRPELVRFRGRRGVVQLRSLVEIADPRTESPRESWVRLAIYDAGLPLPIPQYWLTIDGERCRLDFVYPKLRVVIEYDGEEWHRRTPRQRERDRGRRSWLRRQGWRVIVITKDDFSPVGPGAWIHELRTALGEGSTTLRDLGRWTGRQPILAIRRAEIGDSRD